MLDLIGVTKVRRVNGGPSFTLPDPLRVFNGEFSRIAPNGTKQWNPNWREEGSSTRNMPYLESVVDHVINSSKENVTFSRN